MKQKHHTPEEIVGLLRQAEARMGQGQGMDQICKAFGVSEATYYRWKKSYGSMPVDHVKRLKHLEKENQGKRKVPPASLFGAPAFSATGGSVKAEGLGDGSTHGKIAIAKLRLTMPPGYKMTLRLPWKENSRLKRVVADLTLDKAILQEALQGNYGARRGGDERRTTCNGTRKFRSVGYAKPRVNHAPRTRTLVDAVYDWSRFNSLPRGYGWIRRELTARRVSAADLVKTTLRYGDTGTIRRMGALLEREKADGVLLRRLERAVKPTTSLIPWIPTRPKRGTVNRRWGVVLNEQA